MCINRTFIGGCGRIFFMKFKFNKEKAVQIIELSDQTNSFDDSQQDLTEKAVISIKQMRRNMLNTGGKPKEIILNYLHNKNISILDVKKLEETINQRVLEYSAKNTEEKLEELFHLIQLWGGNTGRNIYVMGGGFYNNINISSYKKLVDTAMNFVNLNDLINQIHNFKQDSTNICTPFITKHTRFFSQHNKFLSWLPIYDSLLSYGLMSVWSKKHNKYIKVEKPSNPKTKKGKDELLYYWTKMIELSNELNKPLNSLERILFNHFRNDP